jgi:hypothetical protein
MKFVVSNDAWAVKFVMMLLHGQAFARQKRPTAEKN